MAIIPAVITMWCIVVLKPFRMSRTINAHADGLLAVCPGEPGTSLKFRLFI
jgi:hypothetical protein